jgi:two-component system phosphate regulon sensor histidine kinase PhoR
MRKGIWLPIAIGLLLTGQVVIWLLIVKATEDRIHAETRARLPVITEKLRENSLCWRIHTERSLPAGGAFTLLAPSEGILNDFDTISDYTYFNGEKMAAVHMPRMPLLMPCAVDIQVKFRFMLPPGSLDTTSKGLGVKVAEEMEKALWTNRGPHKLKLLDTTLLAKLVEEELRIEPIEQVQYAVVDTTTGEVVYSSPGMEKNMLEGSHSIPLFAPDQPGVPWELSIHYPDERTAIMTAEMPWLLFLVLVAAGVSLVISNSVRSAREQRKLADMRMDLVSNISHEFNTPIANITLALETLRKVPGKASRISNEQLWDIIHMESQRLQGTIRKVLDVSLFENQKIGLMQEVHDMHALLDNTVDRFILRSEKENVRFVRSFNAEHNWLKFDATYLSHVFQTIIDNAIKYGGPGVLITVSTRDMRDGICIEIADNGPGISKEDRQRIFEKFYRARRADRYAVQGTGIGLYHARQVVEAHGGTLRSQERPGGGTVFQIFIPYDTHFHDKVAGSRG